MLNIETTPATAHPDFDAVQVFRLERESSSRRYMKHEPFEAQVGRLLPQMFTAPSAENAVVLFCGTDDDRHLWIGKIRGEVFMIARSI